MIEYKNVSTISREPYSVTCDKCKKKYNCKDDVMEVQEFIHIREFGGFYSVFGDGEEINFDICQNCLFAWVGDNNGND